MMDYEIFLWILSGAAGVLLFKFLSLLCWDLLRLVPTPWGPLCPIGANTAWYKKRFKIWFFLAGCGATFALVVCLSKTYPQLIVWALLAGFSLPTLALFVGRTLLAVGYGIFSLYERTELIYDSIKERLVKLLKSKGRIE
jgi:phosphoglycerol transferase MdoB-like AlkP superfamily enzyme